MHIVPKNNASGSFSIFLAMRTKAFEDEVGTLGFVTLGQVDGRDRDVFEANGLSTVLAMEMHMHVVVYGMVAAVAKLIAGAFAILQHMDQMLFLKKRQRAEDARLVDAADAVFELAHREGAMFLGQGLGHDDAVGRQLDAVLTHQCYKLLLVHDSTWLNCCSKAWRIFCSSLMISRNCSKRGALSDSGSQSRR